MTSPTFCPLNLCPIPPTLFLPLRLLYLSLLSRYYCLLDAIQRVSCFQTTRGALQESTCLPHTLLDAIDVTLKYRNKGTRLSVPVHLCGESLVVDVFEGGVEERCLVGIASEPMKVVSKVMRSIDSKVRRSVQWSGIVLIVSFHPPHHPRIHLHDNLDIVRRRLPPPGKSD